MQVPHASYREETPADAPRPRRIFGSPRSLAELRSNVAAAERSARVPARV